MKGFQIYSTEGLCPCLREDNDKIAKICWRNLKIFRATEPISTKLGTKYSWVKGTQVYSNEGPHPLFKGRLLRNSENTLTNLKIFSRTTCPISAKLDTKHPWVKGSQVCSNEGPCPFPRRANNEIAKIHLPSLPNSQIFSILTITALSSYRKGDGWHFLGCCSCLS